jgi:hypothetical protein
MARKKLKKRRKPRKRRKGVTLFLDFYYIYF